MKRHFGKAAAISLATFLAFAAPVSAKDFEVGVDLPKGSVIELVVLRSGSRSSGGQPPGPETSATFRFRQELTPTEDGYRVSQKTVGQELGASQSGQTLTQLGALTPDMTYETRDDLAPAAILEWPKVLDAIMKALGSVVAGGANSAEAQAAINAARAVFAGWTGEQAAASLLREQQLIATPQNTLLDLNKPLRSEYQVANPMGGGPIKGTFTIELRAIDKSAGRAMVVTRDALDPASASTSVQGALKALIDRMPVGAPRPSEAELKSLKMERTTACQYEMDIKTGLTAKADCTVTASAVDQALKPSTTIDRWVMTQALVSSGQ